MNLPDIKDLVRDNKKVSFVRFQNNELWYRCENGFEFPVPVSDTGDAAFLPEDKALVYMRWIRKHIAFLHKAADESTYKDGTQPDGSNCFDRNHPSWMEGMKI